MAPDGRPIGRVRALLSIAIAVALTLPPPAGAEAPRPNVVFILADDLGYGDLGSYGATDIGRRTSTAWHAKGVRFTDFYCRSANTCSPSRAALMTGRYPPRSGVNARALPRHARGAAGERAHHPRAAPRRGLPHRHGRQVAPRQHRRVHADEPRLLRVLRRAPQQRREELLRLRRAPAHSRAGGPRRA